MADTGPIGAPDSAFPGASLARSDAAVLFIQEMLIDIFGIIIPGFCCIVLVVVALAFPLLDLARVLQSLQHLTGLREFLSGNSIAILFTTLLFSFLIGHLLYRQDPKRPDSRSISKCWADIFDNGCVRDRTKEGTQYPYAYLKKYLEERGFPHLAGYVTWNADDFSSDKADDDSAKQERRKRSKHFINEYKMRVKQKNSRLYFDILRNEAHIRFMSSVWYGSRVVACAALLGIIISAAINIPLMVKAGSPYPPYFETFVFPMMVGVLAISIKYSIERFFHYQRVREIVFVLIAWNLTEHEARAPAAALLRATK
jgi:hypothetical protein